ncbi:MAG TPA: hypothetical protein VIY86_07885 [Pirellulaceae bacterium]
MTSVDQSWQFESTFDQVADRLMQLPSLHWEPDGSFLWVGSRSEGNHLYELDGQLIDGVTSLAHCELRGHCRSEELDAVLRTLNWPNELVVFELPETGVFVTEETFRGLYRCHEADSPPR